MKKLSTLVAVLLFMAAPVFAQTPVASFTYSPQCVVAGSTVTFTNTSTGNILYLWSFGDPGSLLNDTSTRINPTHIFSAAGTYTVTLIGTNGTVFDSSTATITVITAKITPATDTICRGGTPTPVTLVASGGGTYAWSNGLGTNATVTVTPFATTTYTVTVTNGNNCTASASTTVVVSPLPVARIVPAIATICSGQSTVLTASGGFGTGFTYAWNNGKDSTAITVSPTATTTYTVTVSAGGACTSTASATVTVANFTPVITPATDTICSGSNTTLTATGGAPGSIYAWSDGGTTAAITVTPTTSTTYTVSVTETNGCSGIATRTVTISGNGVINAAITPAHDTVCLGGTPNPVTLVASGGGTYAWSNGLGTNATVTVTPFATTTYTVTVTNGSCSATASATVVVVRTPTATINPPTSTVCSGHSTVLTASGGFGTGYTYAWSNGNDSAAITVSPTATTTYTVTVSAGGACTSTASTTVTVANFTPVITPATDTICSGSSTTLTATGGAPGSIYAWSNGGTTAAITVTPASTTTYTVSVTETNGCSGIATRTVTISGNGVINAAVTPAQDTICRGGTPTPVTLTASGGGTYAWSNGLGTNATVTVTPFATTTYTVTVTNGSCSAAASATVVVVRTPTAAINPPTSTVCSGHSTVLTATGGFGTGYSYAWSNGNDSAAITVSPTATTTYTVTVSSGGACTSTASTTVTVANFTPGITPATDSICAGSSTTLTATGAGFGSIYAWSNGGITPAITVTPAVTTTYTVSVTETNGCSGIASTTVVVSSNSVIAVINPVPDTICSGQSSTLTASGGTTYIWSTGQRTAVITVTPAITTTYTVTVSAGSGCSASAVTVITVNPSPAAAIAPGGPLAVCSGQSTVLTATGGGTYVWSTGSDSAAITVNPTANSTFSVTVTGANGCTAAATKNVNVRANPTAAIAPANATICLGSNITLIASGGGGFGGGGYAWNTGANTNTITVTPAITTTYTVTVTNGAGCTATASQAVTVDSLPVVSIVPPVDTICAGQTTTLIAIGGPGYAWSNGALSQAIIVTPLVTTVYTVTVTNSNNCSTSASVNVVVNNTPVVALTPGNTAICIGNSTTLTASGGVSYAWSNGSTTAGITVSPVVTTTYDVTVTGANGCSAIDSAIVIASPTLQPVITPANPAVCLGDSTTLTVTAGATYNWSNTSGSQSITVSPTNNSTYTVTVTNGSGCSGTASVNITVFNHPAAAISPVFDSVCAGQSATVTASGGTSYAWSNGTTTASLTVIPVATTTYYVTVTGAGSCTSTDSVTIQVNANPTVRIAPGFANVCSGQSIVLTATGAGVTGTFIYAWSNGNDSASITVSPGATTTYTVTATSAGGCTATASRTVNVNPSPILTITPATDTICSGQSATLTANAGGGGGGVRYRWNTGGGFGGTINVTPAVTTTYTVTATTGGPGGCSATDSVVVVVKPSPTVAISPANVAICGGQNATLTASGGTGYVWSTGSDSAFITVSPTATTTYTVTASGANGCSATASRVVTVRPTPTVIVNPATSSICTGNPVTLTAISGGGFGNTFAWSNGGNTATITVSPTATTTYTVTVTNGGGCSATASGVVIVNSTLVPVITPSNPTVCSGSPVTLTVTAGTTYAWSTGSNRQTINVTPVATTTYTVTVIDGVGCSGTASVNVTVVPGVTAAINPATATVCAGSSTLLTASGGPNFVWSTGSDSASITVTPTGNTTYTVTVSNAAGCSATANSQIGISPAPTVRISPRGGVNICPGGSATLTATTFGGGGPVTFAWSNGNTTAGITVTPAATTTYTVTATNTTGCTASANATVTVNPAPIAAISPATDTICAGSSTTLTASGGGGGFGGGYIWSTGARVAVITVTPAVSTTYNVTVTGGGGCTAVASTTVVVHPRPVATVSPSTDTICSGYAVSLTANGGGTYSWSNNANTAVIAVSPTATTTYTVTVTGTNGCTASAAATITVNGVSAAIAPSVASICTGQTDTLVASGTGTYAWSTGSTSSSIIITPAGTTTYGLTVTAGNNCSSSASATVNVNNNLVPVITPSSVNLCIGNATTLTVSPGTSYQWSNNATTQSILVAPATATTYNVTVSNGVGCSGTASVVVTVNSLPVASVSPATAAVCAGQSTGLTASGGTSYAWSNNNTTAGIIVSPTATTTYTVTVSNAGGCSATASRIVTVNPLPLARITPGAANICLGGNATLTGRGGTGYVWSNGSTTAAITVAPIATTTYTVTVSSVAGCTATATATVTVNTVTATITPATDTICRGGNTTLTASGGTGYRWNNGTFGATNTVAPVVTTTYTVTVTSPGGCSATASRVVNVIVPAASINPLTDSICRGGSTTLTANGGSSYAWNVGAHTQSITVSPIVTTNYVVTVTNNQGCTATATRTVVVKTNPAVSVTPVTDTICGSAHVVITAIGAGTYAWSSNATTQTINVNPTSSTVYTVTLTGSNGCTATASSNVVIKPISASINPAVSSLCQGQNETLTASGGGTYLWNNGSTTSTIVVAPTTTTTYTVIVSASNGCTATANATVNVNGTLTPIITPANPSVCAGGSVTLAVTAGTSYTWNNGASSQSITVSPSSGTSYTVTVSNGVGCSGTATVNVVVNSNPAAQVSPASDTICTNQSALLTASGGVGYAWSNNASTAAITVTPLNTSTYTVTVTNANNCSATASGTVTVVGYPSATISPSYDSICSGQSATLTASGGGTYNWSNNTGNAVLTVSPTTTTTYTVTVTSAGSCTASASAVVTVSGLPTAAIITTSNTICSGQSTTLTATGGVSYAWSNGLDTVSVTVNPTATTTYTVTATNANGCTASASVSITVNNLPNAGITPEPAAICAGGSVTLTASGGTSYAWSNAATSAAIQVSPGATTTYIVTVTSANGCSAADSSTVTVNNNPSVFINPPAAAVCQGSSVTLTAIGGVNYVWSNAGNTDSITISPASTTTYSVTATDANNCSATASEAVTVNSNPVAGIVASADTICSGNNLTLTASGLGTYTWSDSATSSLINVSPTSTTTYTVTVTSFGTGCTATASSTITVNSVNAAVNPALSSICTGQSKTITASGGGTYLWSNASTTAAITVLPLITSTYTVTITGANQCTATLAATVNVNAFLQPVITPANASICSGDTVTLSVTAGTTYHWSTNATTQGITVTPTSGATYTVTVTNNGLCSGTASVNVTVHSNPVASINPATSSICAGQSDSLTAGTGTGYTWSDGSTTSGIRVSPAASTPYSVTVTNSNNCSASASASITVNSMPVASVTPANDTICSGQRVILTASGGSTYNWSGGLTTAVVTENPLSTSTYFVTVTTAFGCSATAAATITVNQTPVAETSPDTASICVGQNVVFTAYDTTGNGNPLFNWSTGATTNSITVNPANTTTYTVTITANHCSSTTTALLIVNSNPVAAIQPVNGSVCLGNSTLLTASGGNGGYIWSTGDSTASISVNPVVNSNYAVTVTNASGCSATASASLSVNNPPTASVSPGSVFVCSGQSATFTVAGGSTYAWSGGQTTPAITVNPTASTNYTVTVSDANGCTASASGSAIVNVAVIPSVTPATDTICAGQNATLTASGDVSYVWSNGGTTAGINVAPASSASYTVTGTDANGCSATAGSAITVKIRPAAAIIPAISALCSGQSTNLSAMGGGSYAWSTGGSVAAITVNPANTTTYTVTVTGSNNCSATASAVVNVNPSLVPVITPTNASICQGNSTTLSVTSGVTYQWSSGATTQSIQVNPTVNTAYTVTVSNGGVCNGSASANVNVNSNPSVFFSPAASLTICSGQSVSITASGGTTYAWGTGSTSATITVAPVSGTRYLVTVTDGNGCSSAGAATVNVNQSSYSLDSVSICSGGTYTFHGRVLTTSGLYADTLSTVNGCDSILALKLNVTPFITNAYGVTVCGGSSFPFAGRNLTQPGVYYDTLTSYQGCDSIIILTLQFGGNLTTTINTSICAGTPYHFGSSFITASGTYYDTLTAQGGCDSIVTLNLVVKAVSASSVHDTICAGSSFNFNGRVITAAGIYNDTLTNSVGCDSIVTLNLVVLSAPSISWNVSDTICTHGNKVVLIPPAGPVGGIYTGTGVVGDSLNLNNAGTPPFDITYTVVGANGCSSSTTIAFITETCAVGINELSLEQQIKMYPNPTSGILVVESALFTAGGPVPVIYDLTGKMVETAYDRQTGKFIFDVGKLAAGVYFVHFNEQGASVNMKFVKLD